MASLALAFDILARDKASQEFNKVGDAVEKAAKKGSLLGSAFGTVLGRGLDVGIGAIKDFAAGAVDNFARVEDATAAAGVVFGSTTPQIVKFAERAAQSFGISKGAALDASLTFGTFGKAAGLSGQSLSDFAQKFTGLAGDIASFRGTSPEQAIEAIGAALRGESEPIRQYGVLLDDATLRQAALKLGLIQTTKQALTPQQKALAAAAEITRQTSDATGDFARTANSTANVQKRLQAETENASAKLGERLAPAITLGREVLLKLIDGIGIGVGVLGKIAGAFEAVGGVVAKVTGFIGDNKAAFAALAVGIVAATGPLILSTAAFIANTVAVNAQVAAYIIAQTATRAYAAGQAALNAVLAANPIGLVIIAVAALAAGLIFAYKHSETFRNIVQGAFRAVAEAVLKTVDFVLSGLQKMFEIAGKIPGIGDKFRGVADQIGTARAAVQGLDDALDRLPRQKVIEIVTRFAQQGSGTSELGAIGRNLLNGRAEGGPVIGGRPYLVGERGTELFVPNQSGTIMPNPPTESSRVEQLLERLDARIASLPRSYQLGLRQGLA